MRPAAAPQARLTYGQEEIFTEELFDAVDQEMDARLAAAPPIDAERAALLRLRSHEHIPSRTVFESRRESAACRVVVPSEVLPSLARRGLARLGGRYVKSYRITKAGLAWLASAGEPR